MSWGTISVKKGSCVHVNILLPLSEGVEWEERTVAGLMKQVAFGG